jgi:hypothetical protein
MAPEPLFGHIGDEISKNRKKMYTWLQRGMKLSLAANSMLNWVCSVLSFPERFQPITTAAMCTVAMNVLEPGAFNAESQYFIPLFNKISWLCGHHPRGYEASNVACNSAPTGHDFPDNSNIYFFFTPWELDPPQIVSTGPVLRLNARWKPGWFSLSGSHWEPYWKPTLVFSRQVRKAQQ